MRHLQPICGHGPLVFSALILLLLGEGCSTVGDVTRSLRIDMSEHPAYQDEQVRFRTTYYFRIVDSCQVQDGKEYAKEYAKESNYDKDRKPFSVRNSGKLKIVSDSLYRFRMTGRASALFARIHFESGVLRAEQIDPFGTKVTLDKDTNTFRVTPASVDREDDRRDQIVSEIRRLKALLEVPKEDQKKNRPLVEDSENIQLIKDMIEEQLKLLSHENGSGVGRSGNSKVSNQLCPNGRPTQRSYSLYGPEGVRHLDPDERLLMAMSSDSKPLIGMLQELAGRSIKDQQSHQSGYKDIADERGRISNAQRDIESFLKRGTLAESEIVELIKKVEARFGSAL